MKQAVRFLCKSVALRYVIVLAVGVSVVGFLDENSVWSHMRNRRTIEQLESEIGRYRSQYERDKGHLRHLDSDPKAVEKIARERYFMKTDDEDIFVLSEDFQTNSNTTDEATQ